MPLCDEFPEYYIPNANGDFPWDHPNWGEDTPLKRDPSFVSQGTVAYRLIKLGFTKNKKVFEKEVNDNTLTIELIPKRRNKKAGVFIKLSNTNDNEINAYRLLYSSSKLNLNHSISVLALYHCMRIDIKEKELTSLLENYHSKSKFNLKSEKLNPYLKFHNMGGIGEIKCGSCGFSKVITSAIHTAIQSMDNFGFQCQSCGEFHSFERDSITNNMRCECLGLLSREAYVFCPCCDSYNVSYQLKCIT